MPGTVFYAGETKIRPDVYVRVKNIGEPPLADMPMGTVAVLFRSSWGPLGVARELEGGLIEVESVYVGGGTVDALKEAFRGNARKVVAYRMGTGGSKASITLKDNADTDVAKVEAKYEGAIGNELKVTVRDSLAETGKRELLVYRNGQLLEVFTFDSGTDEPQALVDAVNAKGSAWISVAKLDSGSGTLATVNQQALTGGADPTVTGTEYSTALAAIETYDFNVLVTDSEDPSIHSAIQVFVDRVRDEGKRIMAVVGEPTNIPLETRLTNAKAFNDEAIVYVANGFKLADGTVIEGYKAAARVAGKIASAPITASLTHMVIEGAVEIVGALTNAEIEKSIQAGALVFTYNAVKQVQIEYGINTLVTLPADMDAGWKKIRRVRTRDYLIQQIACTLDPLIGKVNNSPDGRAILIAAAQGVINRLVNEGALLQGTIYEDPANPPKGDSVWFVAEVDDLDSAEKIYITFGFRFAPPSN